MRKQVSLLFPKFRMVMLGFCLCVGAVSTAQKNVEVTSVQELENAVSRANPGETILISRGVLNKGIIQIFGKGEHEKPIVVKAKEGDMVSFAVPAEIKGEYITLEGIIFSEAGNVELEGTGCRVTRCVFNDSKSGKWIRVLPGSKKIEIDHNLFENKRNNRELERNCQLLQVIVRNENEAHHIHHNLFRDIPKGKTGNGYETVQLITENNPFDPPGGHCNSVIEDNLFIHCNGEAEIISVKSNGNILRRNTFRACEGSLVLRHGDDNLVTGNFFFGEGISASGGVRLQGTDQVVANNWFQDLGQLALGMMDGTPDDLYIRVERAQILFNTFLNCKNTFVIGISHSLHPNGTVPKDCLIAGNLMLYNQPDKPGNFVEYVHNDQPENWKWEGNIACGANVPGDIEGIRTANPFLEIQENGLAYPTSETPEVETNLNLTDAARFDLTGSAWTKIKTPGAIQYPVTNVSQIFLTESEAGPFSE